MKKKSILGIFITSLVLTSCTISLAPQTQQTNDKNATPKVSASPSVTTSASPQTGSSIAPNNNLSSMLGNSSGSSTGTNPVNPLPQTSANPNVIPSAPTITGSTESKDQEYLASCVQSATQAAPSLAPASIQTYCSCTLNLVKSGVTDEQTLIQTCAAQAGIQVKQPSSQSGSDNPCSSGSYEDQLVCSGIPAAALPRVPWQ